MDDLVPVFEQYVVGSVKWFYRFMTPPPVSPLFQPGGALAGYNEDVVFLLAIVVVLFFIDNLIAKRFLHPKARYFFLHAVVNAVVVGASIPDIVTALSVHPYDAFSGPVFTVIGNSAVCALHFYHCIAFEVTADDLFHHVLFVFGMASFGIPLKQNIGAAMAIANCFLSGLPGGIEYVFLILVIHGRMEKRTEKRLFANLNVYMRAPGAVWFVVLAYFSWREGRVTYLPSFVGWPIGLLVWFNGMYYNQIAIESWARFEYKLRSGTLESGEKRLRDEDLPPGSPTAVGALLGDDGVTQRTTKGSSSNGNSNGSKAAFPAVVGKSQNDQSSSAVKQPVPKKAKK